MRRPFLLTGVVTLMTVTLLWPASSAFACGGMVSPSTNAELTSTAAFLSFDGATERLLVQVGFGGTDGDEFAWLLPLPSAPEISRGSTEPLTTALSRTTPPRREDHVPELFPSVCACGADDEGDVAAGGAVENLGTEIVGGIRFDTIAGGGAAVNRYLDRHDFRLDPHQRDAIRDYMSRNWVIVAATVAAGAPPGGRLSAALFSFPTQEAIYPLAMAGDDHAGTMEMDVFTLTPFRPRSTTFEEHVVRPSPEGLLPAPGDRLELVYSAPLAEGLRNDLSMLQPPDDAWFTRYRAHWSIESLDDDLVLGAGHATVVDYQPLLDSYKADARWIPLGRFAIVSAFLAILTLIIVVPVALVVGLVKAVARRRV